MDTLWQQRQSNCPRIYNPYSTVLTLFFALQTVMKFDVRYTTTKSKWYLCFCCLWSRCCIRPESPELQEEYKYLQELTSEFFHKTDWERVYPLCRNLRLVKEAEAEAGVIYKAYISEQLDNLPISNDIPNLGQVLKFWRWLNSDRKASLLHEKF